MLYELSQPGAPELTSNFNEFTYLSFLHFLFLLISFFPFLKILFICRRESTSRGSSRQGEAGSPLSREPNVGLDPRMLGS